MKTEIIDNPHKGTIVQCKWGLCKKQNNEYKICYRARLVKKRFSTKRGVDYTESHENEDTKQITEL